MHDSCSTRVFGPAPCTASDLCERTVANDTERLNEEEVCVLPPCRMFAGDDPRTGSAALQIEADASTFNFKAAVFLYSSGAYDGVQYISLTDCCPNSIRSGAAIYHDDHHLSRSKLSLAS